MKKLLAVLFFFLLPAGLCHAAVPPPSSACFDVRGKSTPCSLDAPLSKAAPSAPENQFTGNEDYTQSLTYAHLGDNHFAPSEIMKETQVINVPASMESQGPFVSLEQDARRQEFWPWRDVIEAGPRKLRYNFNIEDATGRGSVRVFHAKIGVEYEVAPHTAIGIEGIGGVQDSQDAEAWGKSAREEKAAQVKYKIFF